MNSDNAINGNRFLDVDPAKENLFNTTNIIIMHPQYSNYLKIWK